MMYLETEHLKPWDDNNFEGNLNLKYQSTNFLQVLNLLPKMVKTAQFNNNKTS